MGNNCRLGAMVGSWALWLPSRSTCKGLHSTCLAQEGRTQPRVRCELCVCVAIGDRQSQGQSAVNKRFFIFACAIFQRCFPCHEPKVDWGRQGRPVISIGPLSNKLELSAASRGDGPSPGGAHVSLCMGSHQNLINFENQTHCWVPCFCALFQLASSVPVPGEVCEHSPVLCRLVRVCALA